jgi:hypothetical protein
MLTNVINQICINQQDIAEKSAQVALMGRIYQQCSRALIWLGCDASECNLHCSQDEDKSRERNSPFELFRLFDRHISEWPCFAMSAEEDTLVFEHGTAFDGLWKGHVKISDSPWWTRIWTVQEALLPPLALLVYDTWSMPFQEVLDHGRNYFTHSSGCCANVHFQFPEDIMAALATQCVLYAQLHSDSKLLAAGLTLSLDLCHKHYGHRQCRDPRDKIYGMLGLIGNDSGEIVPDYSRSLQEVYYRATCELLARPFGGLQSLRGFQYGPSSDKWASWVRDFDRQWTQFEYQWNATKWVIDQEFGAGGSSTPSDHEKWFSWPCSPKELPNQLALAVTGRCIGTLENVCAEFCQPTLGLFRSTFKAWLQIADFDFEAHAARRRTQTNEQIWRTIVGGVVIEGPEPRRFESDDMVLLDTFVSWIYKNGDMPQAMLPTIAIPTASRTYSRSRSGGHGLCYPTCRPGDQVWVLHGSTVPFVLRPVHVDTEIEANVLRPSESYIRDSIGSIVGVEKDFEPRTGRYQLIGDCYYDGFMDGEALDDEKYPAEHILLV